MAKRLTPRLDRTSLVAIIKHEKWYMPRDTLMSLINFAVTMLDRVKEPYLTTTIRVQRNTVLNRLEVLCIESDNCATHNHYSIDTGAVLIISDHSTRVYRRESKEIYDVVD